MLHNPLFDYNAALSHFLEVRRQRQQHEYISNGGSIVGLCNSSHSGSDTGTVESLSPSPPATVNSNLHHHHHHSMIGTGKSFTIDAILGHRHASSTSPSSSSTTTTKKSSSSNLETVLDFSNSGTPSSNKRFLGRWSQPFNFFSSNANIHAANNMIIVRTAKEDKISDLDYFQNYCVAYFYVERLAVIDWNLFTYLTILIKNGIFKFIKILFFSSLPSG